MAEQPFEDVDVSRVAEFFDGSPRSAYVFARDVWLPEAVATLRQIDYVLSTTSADDDVLFLCDHLREGARVVGASRFITVADTLHRALFSRDHSRARLTVEEGLGYARVLNAWLEERCGKRARIHAGISGDSVS